MTDTSHLEALQLNLSHERARYRAAKNPGERELRSVWIQGLEREIERERQRLGMSSTIAMTIDEIAAELADFA